MIIRNAIRLVQGIDNDSTCDSECGFYLQPSDNPLEELRESVTILELSDFDRLVFVICVVERFSILDCSLLLRRSPKDVNDAIVRATNRVTAVGCENQTETTATLRTSTNQQNLVL